MAGAKKIASAATANWSNVQRDASLKIGRAARRRDAATSAAEIGATVHSP
jgi:hypothetical protein